ncbi:MAG TPA: MFS transporter [Anaerolineales bacterium]|nr:MFS transporter [Anaerolineales bacterium]
MKTSPTGTRAFFTIWFGQLVSLIGSQLTGFALGVWVYDQTHSVSLIALTQVAFAAPFVFLSPLAGVLADRWNRRTAMIVSDFGAGLAVFTTAILYLNHLLQPWMAIPINFFIASFNCLMWPAFTASVTMLVPKEQYGRANGFVQLGEALPQIAGPAIAGVLYVVIRLGNMALIDFSTYIFSVALMMVFVRIPDPPRTADGHQAKGSLWKEMKFGWDYIAARRGLLYLLVFFFSINFVLGVVNPLIIPLILDRWTPEVLGYLSTVMGVGMLVGTLGMSIWGGGKRKIYTLLAGGLLSSLFLVPIGLRVTIPMLAICGFGFMAMIPFMDASSQAIWQSKVAPDVQGRVFAVRRAIAWSSQTIAPLLAGPLADGIFKPAMSAGGFLAPTFGPIIGVGASRGIGLLISLLGILSVLVAMGALITRPIRHVETDLPDHGTDLGKAPVISGEPAD